MNIEHSQPGPAAESVRQNELIDISIPFSADIPPWPGDTIFSCGWSARQEDGSSVNIARLEMSAHSGTHADAPLHVASEWPASETLPIDAFVGNAYVVDVSDERRSASSTTIGADTLAAKMADVTDFSRVLVRTGCSVRSGNFPEAWPSLDEQAVRWLVRRGLRLLGIDAPSVDARSSTLLPVHHALFSAGAYVLENLNLHHVVVGPYYLYAQPLLVVGADAAPVRAILRAI